MSAYKHVIDAAIVGNTTVITYDNGPCQVSFVRLVKVGGPPSSTLTVTSSIPFTGPVPLAY